jgi:ubiquinone/menaquinone biosynthesis C-methylase UbiE
MQPQREYLSYKFEDSEAFVDTFDEQPLWSATFGLLLLKHLEYKKDIAILDIGSGTGFPLLEIAGRFGSTCKCYGLDTWVNANKRARQKAYNYGLKNVEILDGSAEKIPFADGAVDLIVSNLGINNFENPAVVFGESYRALKPGGRLALTTNLDGHWRQFYEVFESTLKRLGKSETVATLHAEQAHRGTEESIAAMFTDSGFKSLRHFREGFEMKFADGSAFLNHYFVKLGWLGSWLELVGDDAEMVFAVLEEQLNLLAAEQGGLTLTVRMLYMEGVKL